MSSSAATTESETTDFPFVLSCFVAIRVLSNWFRTDKLLTAIGVYPDDLHQVIAQFSQQLKGPQIQLPYGMTGQARFVGKIGGEMMFGVEVDLDVRNQLTARTSPVIDGVKYFTCVECKTMAGSCYFIPASKLKKTTKLEAGACVKVRSTGATVRLLDSNILAKYWTVKTRVPAPKSRKDKRMALVCEEDMDLFYAWHLKPIDDEMDIIWRLCKVGVKVRTEIGGVGVIKYIGPVVDGGDDHGENRIGIELRDYDVNAHDGTVNGHTYFSCKLGHGIILRVSDLFVCYSKYY